MVLEARNPADGSGGASASVAFSATTIVRRSPDGGTNSVGRIVGHYGMSMRRLPRLTNAFSKKLENHGATVAVYFM